MKIALLLSVFVGFAALTNLHILTVK